MLTIQNAVLIIVDVQAKLIPVMHNKEDLIRQLRRLIQGAQALNVPTIFTEHCPDKIGKTDPRIKDLFLKSEPITKDTFSCALNDTFNQKLKEIGRTQLIVAGIETHVCIYQTVMHLLKEGYTVNLVADSITSRSEFNHTIGLKRMEQSGALLTNTEMALFEMQEVAKGDTFKSIIKILK